MSADDPNARLPESPIRSVSAMTDRWLPETIRAERSTEEMRQRLLAYFGPMVAVIVAPWLVALFIPDPVLRPPRVVGLGVLALLAGTPLWLRWLPVRGVAWLAVVLVHLAVGVGVVANGGLAGPVAIALPCLPIVTAVLLGSGVGWIDGVLLLVLAAGYEIGVPAESRLMTAPAEVWPLTRLLALVFAMSCGLLMVAGYASLTRQHSKRLQRLAHRDFLTGLHNRHHVGQVMPAECASLDREFDDQGDRPLGDLPTLGIMLIDIDRFKAVNQRWGHHAGDRALVEFANVLDRTSRGSDIVARWGGEEFLVVLRGLSSSTLAYSPRRLLDAVRNATVEPEAGEPMQLTCSIGFAHLPPTPRWQPRWERILQLADAALADAKACGRNCAVGYTWSRRIDSNDDLTRVLQDPATAVETGFLARQHLV